MKKILIALGALLVTALAAPAMAANCGTYPYTLTNGQTADATQVMANFNSVLTCANTTLAHNGANSDITSLTGLTTPLSIAQGGTGSASASAAITALGGLAIANNLSDLASAATARTNLGLGTSATVNTGTSGATIPLLNGTNTWSGKQTLFAATTGTAPFNIPQGVAPSAPSNGDCWTTSTGVYCQIAGSTLSLATTSGAVTSFNTRTGAITLSSSDVTTALTYTPANKAGDTFTGKLNTAASAAGGAGFSLPAGFAPTSPVNGDVWTTTTGLFARVNGATQQYMVTANNLSDLTSASTARTNLGVSATGGDTTYAFRANNLSDLASAATARTNLGLGTSATVNTGTSGATIPLLNGTNTWSATQTFPSASITLSELATQSAATIVANTTGGSASPTAVTISSLQGTTSSTFAAGNDSRFVGPTQNSQSAGYTLALTDGGGQVYHPSADTTARAWVIPANASVAFQIGAKVELINDCSAGVITLSITSDTLVWFPTGTTGTRSIAACGAATLTKVASTRWVLTGVGII
jgi:hypothetical protein